MKVTVVGAGAVGATCADNIARKELAEELVLLDIREGFAEGKAQDIMQSATLLGFDTRVSGSTNDYAKTAGSNVVVITSGLPRKPGMTREELIGTNAGIVKSVAENILKYSPDAILIIISNPMDTMTYLTLKETGSAKRKDYRYGRHAGQCQVQIPVESASRMQSCRSECDCDRWTWRYHHDTTHSFCHMEQCTGYQITFRGKTKTNNCRYHGRRRNAHQTYRHFAPGMHPELQEQPWWNPSCGMKRNYLPAAYPSKANTDQKDICLGVPVTIGKNGWEKIIPFELNSDEKALFAKSAEAVKSMNDVLATLKS